MAKLRRAFSFLLSAGNRTWIALLLGSLGIAIGIMLLRPTPDLLSPNPEPGQVSRASPEVLLWMIIYCTQIAFYLVALAPAWRLLLENRRYFPANWPKIVFPVIGLVIFIVGVPVVTVRSLIPDIFSVMPNTSGMERWTWVLLGIVGIPTAMGALLADVGLRSVDSGNERKEDAIRLYLGFRDCLQQSLWISGAGLGLTILSAGAVRQIHISLDHLWFSPLYTLEYGAVYSIILVLFYAPMYSRLIGVGRRLCESLVPLPLPDSQQWAEACSKRKDLEELLQVNTTVRANLQGGAAILTPLLGGIVSNLLPGAG